MKTVDVTLTVRDEQGNVSHREEFMRATSRPGWQCGHDVWSNERYVDEQEDMDSTAPVCQWCQSQGLDGTLRPVEVAECELCDELYEWGYFTKTHIGECGI